MSFENKLNKIKNDWPIWKIGRNEVDFPKSLLEVKPAINQLYIRGIWRDDIFDNCAAIVGSRRMTRYGRQVCESVVVKLVSTKKVIVSGFMYGIDTQAHQKTLEFGGITMAVLGGGLNWIYPEENIDLYLQILNSGGLILSEFEPEYKPSLWTFPQRNRIVAGLADEVFVVEAGFKSGSLITANLAYKMGKKVWAVPGMIDSPTSQGTNQLIADNKAVILNNLDILDQKAGAKQENLFDKGSELLMEINSESQTVDQLAKKLKRSIPEISIELTNLVLSGQIEEENGKYYRLRKP